MYLAEMRIAICDDSLKAFKLLSFDSLIKFIILFDDEHLTDELKQKADKIGVRIHSFEEVKRIGRSKIHPVQVNIFDYFINRTISI
jgi:hypothetical protein